VPSTSTSGHSLHALVSPSSLGPPSPSSTPSSSPPNISQLNTYDFTGFNQAFPSIDELDEAPTFSLPSVPTGIGGTSHKDLRNGDLSPSPLSSFRNFTVPIERPSSTPITPTNNAFSSRPPSPNKSTIPPKPSTFSNGVTSASSKPKVPIPVKNIAFPKDLLAYIQAHKVLLIDVRTRAEFDREHIKANAVVCIEPSVLMREGYAFVVLLLVLPDISLYSVTADALENSMVVGPRQEVSLFSNRDKFDLVAVYDDSSTSFGVENSPLSTLVRVISEQAFRKMLKRMPMMLVGGIEAWKKDLGEAELVRGPGYMEIERPERPAPRPTSILLASSPSARQTTFGTANLVTSNSTGSSYESKASRSRPEGVSHHVSMSLDQSGHHTRYVVYKLICIEF
jgi:ubiquitin carboxyl-terminal hydrolase 8